MFMRDLKSFTQKPRSLRGLGVTSIVLATWLLGATSARAEASPEDKRQAAAAYARATEANERGDFLVAARELALADELMPNAVTLQAALEAALDADAPTLGMDLALRAEKRKESGELGDLAAKVRQRFSGRVGRVQVVCPVEKNCSANIDGENVPLQKEHFVLVGKHVAIVSTKNNSVRRDLDVPPMGLVIVTGPDQVPQETPAKDTPAKDTPAKDTPAKETKSGLSPAWFVAGLVTTVGAGVGMAISGADTKEKHDTFLASRCAEVSAPATCTDVASEGRSAQNRTNVLVGATAALGVTTIVLGVLTFSKKNSTQKTNSAFTIEPRKDGAFARLIFVWP
jgi:hypothetical protein